jgi:four helix bundle protein
MTRQDLGIRTKKLAATIVFFYAKLPKREEAIIIGRQLLRSGTSVGAHYREAIRSRSNAEFISKIETGLQELEESRYWLELLIDTKLVENENCDLIIEEIKELIAIFVTMMKNLKTKKI